MTHKQIKRGLMVCVPPDANVKALQAISCYPGVIGLVGHIHPRSTPFYNAEDKSVLVIFPDMHAPIHNEWNIPLTELRIVQEENQ